MQETALRCEKAGSFGTVRRDGVIRRVACITCGSLGRPGSRCRRCAYLMRNTQAPWPPLIEFVAAPLAGRLIRMIVQSKWPSAERETLIDVLYLLRRQQVA